MDRLALACFLGTLVLTSPADRTVQAAAFYYQRVDAADIPALNRHRLVVMNYLPQQAAIFSQVSPETKAIYYHLPCMVVGNTGEWAEVNANESWFLHDGLGQRIRFPGSNDTYPHYYTDVSNPEYLAFKIARYQGLLALYPWLDGFYLDFPSTYQGFDLYTRPVLDCANDIPPGNSLPGPFTSPASWDAFYAPALASIKSALGAGVIVVANDWLYGPLSEAAGGGFGEHMFHFYWGSRFYSESSWRQQVDLLAAPSLADRTSLVLSTMAPSDDFERSIRFSLASFLLGKRTDSDAYFAFRDSPNSAVMPNAGLCRAGRRLPRKARCFVRHNQRLVRKARSRSPGR